MMVVVDCSWLSFFLNTARRLSMNEERLLTPDQLAEKLHVRKSWVYSRSREIDPNAIPRVKVGKYLRFPERQVMKWLQRQNGG
jgi:excisionase family DNA binding protein